MWWIYNSSYHSLVTRTILTNKCDKSTFPSIVESQKNSFTTRVWPLCVGMWGMMCLWWCRQLGADVEACWVSQEHASYLCLIFGSKLNDAMNFLLLLIVLGSLPGNAYKAARVNPYGRYTLSWKNNGQNDLTKIKWDIKLENLGK